MPQQVRSLSAGSSACSTVAHDLDLLPPFQTPLRVAEKACLSREVSVAALDSLSFTAECSMQLSSNPMPEQCQLLSVGIFSLYQAGYERKDSGERECKTSNPSSTQNSVGKPAKTRRHQNTAARVFPESIARSASPVCEKACVACGVSSWPVQAMGALHKPSSSVYTKSKIDFPSNHSIGTPLAFLADLPGGAALWAVSADTGKTSSLSTEAFSGRSCRLDLGD